MRGAIDLLLELKALGVRVAADGERLNVDAPSGVLTQALVERLGEHKPDLLRLLQSAATPEPMLDDAPEDEGPQPLSRAQQSIWFLEQISPGTRVWNIGTAFDVEGELDVEALNRAFREILTRQSALRSRFVARDDQPEVEITPLGDWRLPVVDVSGEADPEARVSEIVETELKRPFDLATGPLYRFQLVRVAERKHVLLLALHHIIADGWSLGLIGRELNACYEAFSAGRPVPLSPLSASYGRFARLERAQEPATEPDLNWWRAQLAEPGDPTTFQPVRTRVPSGAGRRFPLALGPELTAAIEALARRSGATPFMVMLAAFDTLVHRYTGLTDLMVGSPVWRRDRTEFDDVVGMFVNTLVMRVSLEGDPSFAEVLERVRRTSGEAFRRQHVAFDRIVEAVAPPRQLGFNPLVQLSFAFQNVRLSDVSLGEAKIARRPLDTASAYYELAIEVWRTEQGYVCDVEYSTDLFDAAFVERLARGYARLLQAVVEVPEMAVSKLPVLTDEDRSLLARWGEADAGFRPTRRLEAMFAEQAAATPEAPALLWRGRTLTYAELDARANQLAHRLRALGVGPEVRVGLALDRTPDLIVSMLAVLKAGGAYVPIDPRYPEARREFMLQDCAVSVLIGRDVLTGSIEGGPVLLDLDAEASALAALPREAPEPRGSLENTAYVLYTSGSTGRAKGVMIAHSGGCLIEWARRTFSPRALSRVAATSSFCFDFSVFEMYAPLCTGGLMILKDSPLEPFTQEERPTLMCGVPSAWTELANAGALSGSLIAILCGGEALKAPLVEMLYERSNAEQVVNVYGPTETTTCCTATVVPRGSKLDASLGTPLPGAAIRLLDRAGELVPIGVPGEVHVGGAMVSRGYLERPDLTAERFVAAGDGGRWYRTGDYALWSEAGELQFVGRRDRQIKLRGFRIELGEVESAIARLPEARDNAVLVREVQPGDERLVAYVESDADLDPAILRRTLAGSLPAFMVPSLVVVMRALPRTPSGKIDREALPAPTAAAEPAAAPAPAPTLSGGRLPIEQEVALVFKEVLGVADCGPDDNFFDLGGHSLTAVRAAARLEFVVGQSISPAMIFQAPTPRTFVAALDRHWAGALHLAPLQTEGDRPPIFCIADVLGRPLSYVSLARRLKPDQPLYGLCPGPLEDEAIARPSFEVLTRAYIDEIRRVQPKGPYTITGYSFGGVQAFDLACALEAEGEEVFLILIDHYLTWRPQPVAEFVKWLTHHGRRAVEEVGLVRTLKFAVAWFMLLLHIPRPIKVAEWVPEDARTLAKSLFEAAAAYRPRPFGGRTLIVQSDDRLVFYELLDYDGAGGLSRFLKGDWRSVRVEGDHLQVMREPRVARVAEIFRRAAPPETSPETSLKTWPAGRAVAAE